MPERGKWYCTWYEGGEWDEVELENSPGWWAREYSAGNLHTLKSDTCRGHERVLVEDKDGRIKLAAAVLFPNGRIYDPIAGGWDVSLCKNGSVCHADKE